MLEREKAPSNGGHCSYCLFPPPIKPLPVHRSFSKGVFYCLPDETTEEPEAPTSSRLGPWEGASERSTQPPSLPASGSAIPGEQQPGSSPTWPPRRVGPPTSVSIGQVSGLSHSHWLLVDVKAGPTWEAVLLFLLNSLSSLPSSLSPTPHF